VLVTDFSSFLLEEMAFAVPNVSRSWDGCQSSWCPPGWELL